MAKTIEQYAAEVLGNQTLEIIRLRAQLDAALERLAAATNATDAPPASHCANAKNRQ